VPAYDYRCDQCDRTFEVRQRISEAPLTTCDRCGGPIHRLLAPAPFILKGGGWYVTDYPSEGRKKGMEADKKSSTESAGSTSGTTSGSDGAASTTSPAKSGAASGDASTATASKSTSTSSS
jgi:putative FmdB family regulatory protein